VGAPYSDALFRGVFEVVPDAVLVVDDGGRIVIANERCREVFGRDPETLVGRPVDDLVPRRFRPGHRRRRDEYGAAPQPRPLGLLRLSALRADGTEFPAEISLASLEADGRRYVATTVRDITVPVRDEQRVRDLVSERSRIESESQRLRDEVIATVSHELRTPLTSIIGYAELLADLDAPDVSARTRRLVAVIERNAQRELKLVDDLLTLAYLDDDRLRLHRAPTDLVELSHRVVDDAVLRARERGLTLSFDRSAPSGRPVLGDAFRLVQVLENLVTNALKFTPPGGRVEVAVSDGGDHGVVEVRDTGIGVTPEERERVFERLYRAPGAVARQTQGAGLGLAIVRAIVEAHEGSIEVDSEVGVGTVFRVRLPYAG